MSRPITPDELKKFFPGASNATLKQNSGVADAAAQPGTVTKRLTQQRISMAAPVARPVCNPGTPKDSHESNHSQGLCAAEPKQTQGPALERRAPRKGKSSKGDIGQPKRASKIAFHIYALRPCDWDNYRIKYVQDWLIRIGVIPGDAWDELSGEVKSFKVSSKEDERTEILIL